jgi:hypothetical protein
VRARRGNHIAAVAVARKLTVIIWQLLTKSEDYAWGRPALHAKKIRDLELRAGHPERRGQRGRSYDYNRADRRLEDRARAEQAERTAALSTIPYFDPAANGAPKKINGSKVPGDKDKFTACMLRYFPWGSVRGVDLDAEKACLKVPPDEENANAADKLYSLLHNPMMHSGGAVGRGFPRLGFGSPFPGLGSFEENERALCEWCAHPDLRGQRFLTYDATRVTVDARAFYWATAADDRELRCRPERAGRYREENTLAGSNIVSRHLARAWLACGFPPNSVAGGPIQRCPTRATVAFWPEAAGMGQVTGRR